MSIVEFDINSLANKNKNVEMKRKETKKESILSLWPNLAELDWNSGLISGLFDWYVTTIAKSQKRNAAA